MTPQQGNSRVPFWEENNSLTSLLLGKSSMSNLKKKTKLHVSTVHYIPCLSTFSLKCTTITTICSNNKNNIMHNDIDSQSFVPCRVFFCRIYFVKVVELMA